MSIYDLNSIVKKIDEKNLSDISDVLNKKDIWIKHPLRHTERIGWLDFNKVTNSSQDECSKTIKNLDSKKFIFIGMGGSIQTGKVLSQISNENNMLFIDSTNPMEIKSISEKLNLKECIICNNEQIWNNIRNFKINAFFYK